MAFPFPSLSELVETILKVRWVVNSLQKETGVDPVCLELSVLEDLCEVLDIDEFSASS